MLQLDGQSALVGALVSLYSRSVHNERSQCESSGPHITAR